MTPPLSPPLSRAQTPHDPSQRISHSSDSSIGSSADAASMTDGVDAFGSTAPLAARRPLPSPFTPLALPPMDGQRSPPAYGPGAIAGQAAARRKAEEIAAIDALESYFARIGGGVTAVEPVSVPLLTPTRSARSDELRIDLGAYADSPTLGGRPSTFVPAQSPVVARRASIQHSALIAAPPPSAPLPAAPRYDADPESDGASSEDDLDRTLVGAGKGAAPFEVAMFLPSQTSPDGHAAALAIAKTWHSSAAPVTPTKLPIIAERHPSIASIATIRTTPSSQRSSIIQAMPPSFSRRSSDDLRRVSGSGPSGARRRPLSVNLSLSPGERPSSIVFGPEDVRLLREYAGPHRSYSFV